MIQLHHVSKSYAPKSGAPIEVLKDLDLSIEAGTFAAISGASGCGKSTLLLIAGGLMQPDQGEVTIAGQSLSAMRSDQLGRWRAKTVGFVFQRFHLLPYLSVRENILAATVALKTDSDGVEARAAELMRRLGLADRAGHFPGELSVGEMQRTALARAMLNEPQVILADEPTGNLDPTNARIVLDAFAGFSDQGGTALMVTHNPSDAARANQQWRMSLGCVTRA
jgi:ABC-type lipoprotein export system ATPase subunit